MILYQPSNGTEGCEFESQFCEKCDRERLFRKKSMGGGCQVLFKAMSFDINHPYYPKEWISDDDGRNPRCTVFISESDAARKRKEMAAKAKAERIARSGQLKLF